MTLIQRSLRIGLSDTAGAWGLLLLRAVTGGMIFYIHGWHKLLGGIDYLFHGTSWMLAKEVGEMRVPAPLVAAWVATLIQLIGGGFLVVGLATRVAAFLLAGTLGVAILQNLLAGRDPQLALLYTLNVATLCLLGGGRFSLDAKFSQRSTHKVRGNND